MREVLWKKAKTAGSAKRHLVALGFEDAGLTNLLPSVEKTAALAAMYAPTKLNEISVRCLVLCLTWTGIDLCKLAHDCYSDFQRCHRITPMTPMVVTPPYHERLVYAGGILPFCMEVSRTRMYRFWLCTPYIHCTPFTTHILLKCNFSFANLIKQNMM